MEGLDDVCLEGFPLFLIRVLVFVCDEVSVGAVEGEHQAVKFAVGDNGGLEVGVTE